MKYVYSDKPVEAAADHVVQVIKRHLSDGQSVVWLLSGGSGVSIAIKASQQLADIDLSKLTVSLTDERYGAVGHPDENWQQLLDGGLSLQGAELYRPLQGKSLSDTAKDFGSWLETHLTADAYKLGIFGVGGDGHTAGIKPNSVAATAKGYASGYQSEDFERLTMTFQAIDRLDEVVIQMSGADKQPALQQLLSQSIPLTDMPSQILHKVPVSTLYTNIQEEKSV